MELSAVSKTSERLLAEWMKYCKCNSDMHNDSRGHFKSLNYGLTIPSLILGSITGIGTIGLASNGSTGCQKGVDWIFVGLGIVGIVSTCLASIHRFINAPQLQTEHDLYSDLFASLHNEIDMQMTLEEAEDSKMFRNSREFMKYCKGRMDVLMDKAPAIPKGVRRKHDDDPTITVSTLNPST